MLRSNTAHLQSEDKSAEPPQEQRPRRRVTKKEEDSHLPLLSTQRNIFFRTNSWKTWNVFIVSESISLHLKSRVKVLFLRNLSAKVHFFIQKQSLDKKITPWKRARAY